MDLESLNRLIRNIICNFSLLKFSLIIRGVGLTNENGKNNLFSFLFFSFPLSKSFNFQIAEILLAIISNNITTLDMSDNQLSYVGLESIGTGIAVNTCIQTLHLDYCFKVVSFPFSIIEFIS